MIGGISLDKINRLQGTGGGGIWLNSQYHGKGYGREAFAAKINFAFKEIGLRRLENGYFEGNIASFKMLSSLHYQAEGLRRQAFLCLADGVIKDEHIMGLLKEDWSAN